VTTVVQSVELSSPQGHIFPSTRVAKKGTDQLIEKVSSYFIPVHEEAKA